MKIYLCGFLFLISCGPEKTQIKNPIIYIKANMEGPKGCENLGIVTGVTFLKAEKGRVYLDALKDLQSGAEKRGADYIHIMKISEDMRYIKGIAYLCK